MRMRRVGLLVLPLVAVSLLLVPSQAAERHPDSREQPERDGCDRNPAGLLAGTSPAWAYVNRDAAPKYASGRVRHAQASGDDLFTTHDSYDLNLYLEPNQPYRTLMSTANMRREKTQKKDEFQTLTVEWEQAAAPPWVWPTAGDRLEVLGSWVWDCAHWREETFTDPTYWQPNAQDGEPVTGERTELHPLRMLVVHRGAPSLAARGEAVTDALISSAGTVAKAVADKVLGGCVLHPKRCPQWNPVNDRNYTFNVVAPPRPRGARRLVWRALDQGSVNAPNAVVAQTRRGIQVTVPFKGWGRTGDPMVFAKRYVVGWDVAPRAPLHHYRVRLDRFTWLTELDGTQPFTCLPTQPCTDRPQISTSPSELNVYVDVAGQWRQLDVPSPQRCATETRGLFCVAVGDIVPLRDVIDVWLPRGATWRVFARVRECDETGMRECPLPHEIGLNDDGGMYTAVYRSGARVGGRKVGLGMSEHCTDAAKSPCYRLEYRIEDLGTVR